MKKELDIRIRESINQPLEPPPILYSSMMFINKIDWLLLLFLIKSKIELMKYEKLLILFLCLSGCADMPYIYSKGGSQFNITIEPHDVQRNSFMLTNVLRTQGRINEDKKDYTYLLEPELIDIASNLCGGIDKFEVLSSEYKELFIVTNSPRPKVNSDYPNIKELSQEVVCI